MLIQAHPCCRSPPPCHRGSKRPSPSSFISTDSTLAHGPLLPQSMRKSRNAWHNDCAGLLHDLYATFPSPFLPRPQLGRTALHLAAFYGQLSLIDKLLVKGADINAVTDEVPPCPFSFVAPPRQRMQIPPHRASLPRSPSIVRATTHTAQPPVLAQAGPTYPCLRTSTLVHCRPCLRCLRHPPRPTR